MHHQTDSFYMTKKAKNKEAAKLWLEYITTLEVQKMYPEIGFMPAAHLGVPKESYPTKLLADCVAERDKWPGPNSLDIGTHPEVAAEAMRQLQNFVSDTTSSNIEKVVKEIQKAADRVKTK